jgi:hypothetical protein
MQFMKIALTGRDTEDFLAPPPEIHNAAARKLDTPDSAPSPEPR